MPSSALIEAAAEYGIPWPPEPQPRDALGTIYGQANCRTTSSPLATLVRVLQDGQVVTILGYDRPGTAELWLYVETQDEPYLCWVNGRLVTFDLLDLGTRVRRFAGASPSTPEPTLLAARATVRECVWFLSTAISIHDSNFPEIPVDVVLAIAAMESGCNPRADDGVSVGLMAVTPRDWIGPRAVLLNDTYWNVFTGMWLLEWARSDQEHNPEASIIEMVAEYNCSRASLDAGTCWERGGYAYAADVLGGWVPLIQAMFVDYCAGDVVQPPWPGNVRWLRNECYCPPP
ncbi:MAG: hypothetical protein MUP86_02460 [Dehalococcoidia bacterium]|nr:hypothetical protein [Dehalococcoidia bacterium]